MVDHGKSDSNGWLMMVNDGYYGVPRDCWKSTWEKIVASSCTGWIPRKGRLQSQVSGGLSELPPWQRGIPELSGG